jgi:hypothetical protein
MRKITDWSAKRSGKAITVDGLEDGKPVKLIAERIRSDTPFPVAEVANGENVELAS